MTTRVHIYSAGSDEYLYSLSPNGFLDGIRWSLVDRRPTSIKLVAAVKWSNAYTECIVAVIHES